LGQALRARRGARLMKRADAFFLRAESYYNVATELEALERACPGLLHSSYGGKSPHEQSHGESFLALLKHRFGGNGLYLLDEPESALSPIRQMSFLAIMHRLIQRGSQFIIATHSPIIMGYPDATIYQLSERGVEKTNYVETEHYKVTQAFLSRRDAMLSELFKPEEPDGETQP
jgi:predicted ATPase